VHILVDDKKVSIKKKISFMVFKNGKMKVTGIKSMTELNIFSECIED
jgi:hypothetical protein